MAKMTKKIPLEIKKLMKNDIKLKNDEKLPKKIPIEFKFL
jgi:hypothetical protein